MDLRDIKVQCNEMGLCPELNLDLVLFFFFQTLSPSSNNRAIYHLGEAKSWVEQSGMEG